MSTMEVVPDGYTAKLDAQAAGQLRSALADGVATAEQVYATNNAVFDEIAKQEMIRDSLRGMDRPPTAEEDQRWDDATARIEELEANTRTETFDNTIFAEGSVSGQWADVHYRVDLDDYAIGVQVTLGAVPHGSDRDLSGYEQAATLNPAERPRRSSSCSTGTWPGPPAPGPAGLEQIQDLATKLGRVTPRHVSPQRAKSTKSHPSRLHQTRGTSGIP